MNALDLLNAITYADKVETIIRSTTQTLLSSWRKAASGNSDDDILRDKLVESGWKYSRQKGKWIHPKVGDYPAPKMLQQLAEIVARSVIDDVLRKEIK